jgi:hypothetical protein
MSKGPRGEKRPADVHYQEARLFAFFFFAGTTFLNTRSNSLPDTSAPAFFAASMKRAF